MYRLSLSLNVGLVDTLISVLDDTMVTLVVVWIMLMGTGVVIVLVRELVHQARRSDGVEATLKTILLSFHFKTRRRRK